MPYLDAADAINARSIRVGNAELQPDEPWTRVPLIGGPTLRLVQLAMPPGRFTIPHYHPRAAEFFLIQAGEGELWIGDGGPVPANPGDLLYAPIGVVHGIVAGATGLRLLAGMGPNDNLPNEQDEVELEGYPR